MSKAEYIEKNSKILLKLERQKKNLNNRLFNLDLGSKAYRNNVAELDRVCMHYSMTSERIGYALGYLTLFEVREEYNLNGWQKYKGIKDELRELNFD